MIDGDGIEWFWTAIGIALFVCACAAVYGDPDPPGDLPRSSMDL